MIKNVSKEELKQINGGSTSLTGSLIDAFTDAVKTIFEVGKSLGSSVRRIKEKKLCEIS